METWHLSYDEVMSMPTTRRHRIILKKVELERKREEQQRNQMQQSRSRMRR